jgi:hypothetical protein
MKKTVVILMILCFQYYFSYSQDISLEPNFFMKIESGTNLKMGAGDLIIESNATGDASLIDLGTVSFTTGTAHVERYLSDGEWHLISSPVSDAFSGMFLNDYLQYHSENTNLYTEIIPTNVSLNIMQGYALWTVDGAPTTETFIGSTNTGNKSINFTKTDLPNNDDEGWNLIGNPYPSAIDWDLVTIPENLSGAIWVFDPGLGAMGSYRYYINGGGVANTTTQYIPSGQGFFVRATGGNGSLQLTNSIRTHNSQGFYKESDNIQTDNTLLVIKASNGEITNQMAIRFDLSSTSNYDRLFDVPCILSSSPDVPNLFSILENQKMSINTFPKISGSETVSFYVQMTESNEIILKAEQINTIPAEYPIYLEDVTAQVYQDLRLNNEYSFHCIQDNVKEFKIHFKDVTGLCEMISQNIFAYFHGNNLSVNIISENIQSYHLRLFTISGKELISLSSNKKHIEIPISSSSGIYLLKIEDSKNTFQQKIFKK